jgi:outer membrane immunogenic protein
MNGIKFGQGQMTKRLISAVAFSLLALPAMAADLAPVYKAPVYKAPVPACIWCGFYLGLNAGGTWSNNNSVTLTSAVAQDFGLGPASYGAASTAGAAGSVPVGSGAGFIGGGQIGYNWQLAGAWIGGLETDIQGVANGSGSGVLGNTVGPIAFFGNADSVTTSISTSKQLDYFGTLRGRLGYLFGPTFLAYGTGGLAYGGVKASTSIVQTNNDCSFSPGTCIQPSTSAAGAISQTRVGWTAGAGLEWLFATRWSAKVEYLYYDLGSVNFASGALVTTNGTFPGAGGPAIVNSTSSADFRGNIVRVGVNYHWY